MWPLRPSDACRRNHIPDAARSELSILAVGAIAMKVDDAGERRPNHAAGAAVSNGSAQVNKYREGVLSSIIRQCCTPDLREGCQQVCVMHKGTADATRSRNSWPADDEWNAGSPFIRISLASAPWSIRVLSDSTTVWGHQDLYEHSYAYTVVEAWG